MASVIKLKSPYPSTRRALQLKKESKPNQGRENRNRQVYDDSRWRKLSRQIRQQEPLCRLCLTKGVHSLSEVVDHIVPINSGGDPFDPDNLQPLCRSCHERKSAREKHSKA